jgi:hypothetical protein
LVGKKFVIKKVRVLGFRVQAKNKFLIVDLTFGISNHVSNPRRLVRRNPSPIRMRQVVIQGF